MPEMTVTQWSGVAAAITGLAVLWGPSVYSFLKERLTPKPSPTPVPEETPEADQDYLDLHAMRRLHERGVRLGCRRFLDGIIILQSNFFGCVDDDPQ